MWRTRIGDTEVFRVEEMLRPGFDPAFLYPNYDPGILDAHPLLARPEYFDHATGRLMSSMQSWLVRAGREVIVIDTGCGNGKTREHPAFQRFHMLNLPFLDNLAACGVRPQDVTMVINTHLHVDHVGWNTSLVDGRWVPTFPQARYVMPRAELAHWHDPSKARRSSRRACRRSSTASIRSSRPASSIWPNPATRWRRGSGWKRCPATRRTRCGAHRPARR